MPREVDVVHVCIPCNGRDKFVDNVAGYVEQFKPKLVIIDKLRENEPSIIYGDGEQTRDFLYVEDAVEACMLSLSSENCVGEVINVGTGIKTTINELADLLIKLMKKAHITPIHAEPGKGDIKNSYADISKAQKTLGYKPKVTLEKGLKNCLLNISRSNFFNIVYAVNCSFDTFSIASHNCLQKISYYRPPKSDCMFECS